MTEFKKWTCLFLASVSISAACTKIVKPMTCTFDGDSGYLIKANTYNKYKVNIDKAVYLTHVSMISCVGASRIEIVRQPVKKGDQLIIDIEW